MAAGPRAARGDASATRRPYLEARKERMLEHMKLRLKIWRQPRPGAPGRMVDYDVDRVSPDMSFLEMLDALNEKLILAGEDPVAFDHDCREGICGSCGF